MMRDDEFIGRLEDYLDGFDGVTPLPDRVRDAVHAALPGIRQARRVPTPRRGLATGDGRAWRAVSGLVAAVLILSIGTGALVLSSARFFGTAPSPSPSPSPTPSGVVPPPSGLAIATVPPVSPGTLLNDGQYRSCGRGGPPTACLTAGTYALGNGLLGTPVTVVVPTGWFEWDMGSGTQGLLVDDSRDGPQASGWGLLFLSVGAVSRDPCDLTKGTVPADQTRTVDGLVGAMSRWPGFHVTRPTPVEIGGIQGQQVQVTATPTTGTCPDATIWTTPQGTAVNGYPMVADRPGSYPTTFTVLDVGGELLVLRATDFPQLSPTEISEGRRPDPVRHVADQQTLHAILDSIRFGQRP